MTFLSWGSVSSWLLPVTPCPCALGRWLELQFRLWAGHLSSLLFPSDELVPTEPVPRIPNLCLPFLKHWGCLHSWGICHEKPSDRFRSAWRPRGHPGFAWFGWQQHPLWDCSEAELTRSCLTGWGGSGLGIPAGLRGDKGVDDAWHSMVSCPGPSGSAKISQISIREIQV